jgi:hypothetical protein
MSHTTSVSLSENASSISTQDLTPEDHQLIGQLTRLWEPYQKRGLEVRWKTGALLNKRLGLPTERLAHGQHVLKTVAKQLQIAECDLSRMRWFAHRFQSVEDLQQKHSEIRTWTQVKELLASLNAGCGNGEKSSKADSKAKSDETGGNGEQSSDTAGKEGNSSGGEQQGVAVLDDILRSLGNATEQFRQNGFALDEAMRKRMRKAVEQLVEVVADRLKIRLKIEEQEA